MSVLSLDTLQIDHATAADARAIGALLRTADLPDADFAEHLANFLVARCEGRVVGAVGLERHGAEGLLRSLVVDPSQRSCGLGTELVRRIEVLARELGLQTLHLLTTTAEDFFARRGYARVARAGAPAAIAATGEFRTLCPVSAVYLRRDLAAPSP